MSVESWLAGCARQVHTPCGLKGEVYTVRIDPNGAVRDETMPARAVSSFDVGRIKGLEHAVSSVMTTRGDS